MTMCFPAQRSGEDEEKTRKGRYLKLVTTGNRTGVVISETNLLVLSISVLKSSQQQSN